MHRMLVKMWYLLCIFVAFFGLCSGQITCAQPNIAGIVVGSIFGTLAVVALILGIIGFLLWRRNKALKPQKTRKVNAGGLTEDRASPTHEGHVNPAFNDNTADISAAEAGFAGYVPCGEYVPTPNKNKSPVSKDDKRKTWTSLPQSDIPQILQRHGSCGSLDDNYLNSIDPEEISVWLQSQDFIGLGFNISGNMRDGIHVSHVHNRGPAIESGKVKVGDRIKNVTISFENMVYEDALTILSYASPYPVKVTLQKEKALINDAQTSDPNDNLSHPLYRSQSLDALQRIGKDPIFKPKRTQSEMKPETRKDSARAKKLAQLELDGQDVSEGSASQKSTLERKSKTGKGVEFSDGQVNTMMSNVMVHVSDEAHQKSGIDIPDIGNIDLSHDEEPPVFSEQAVKSESAPVAKKEEKHINTSAALEFASLMDQMLDLKENSNSVQSGHVDDIGLNVSLETDSSSKTPTKPQRKKRGSSSTSPTNTMSPDSLIQAEFVTDVQSAVRPQDGIVEDMIVPVITKTVKSARSDWRGQEEVEEEEIVPDVAKKEIQFGTDEIVFSEKEVVSSNERPPSPVGIQESFSSSMSSYRPKSPEGDPVEEELIEASVAKRDASAPPPPQIVNDDIVAEEIVPVQAAVNFSAPKVSKKKEPKKKAPELDEEMLEQIITMNAQPPGTTALQWRKNNDSFEIPDKDRPTSPKGIAFEIRDDIMTGLPRAVDLNKSNIARTMSYDLKLTNDSDKKGSLRDERSSSSERIETLDWSGTRLVRSGSFTDISQNETGSDWTDKNDGSITLKTINLSSDSEGDRVMKRTTDVFAPRENLANLSGLSGLSDNQFSITSDSTDSLEANGDELEITSSYESVLKNNNIDGLPSLEKGYSTNVTSDKKGSYSIKLSMDGNDDDDVEC